MLVDIEERDLIDFFAKVFSYTSSGDIAFNEGLTKVLAVEFLSAKAAMKEKKVEGRYKVEKESLGDLVNLFIEETKCITRIRDKEGRYRPIRPTDDIHFDEEKLQQTISDFLHKIQGSGNKI